MAAYSFDFKDELGNAWDVSIIQRNNLDPVVKIKGSGNPVIISYRQGKDLFESLLTSEVTIEVISESDLFFKSFFTAPAGEWRLTLTKNSNIFWRGQNVVESYSEPYILFPYVSQLRFSDLGDMDFLLYKNGANFFSGYRRMSQIILDCTNKLEIALPLTELINVVTEEAYLDNSTFTANSKSSLRSTNIDARAFIQYKNNQPEPMTCAEVLKRILGAMKCRMFQYNARYYILRIEECANANGDITASFDIDTSGALTATQYTTNILKTIDNIPLAGITPISQNQDLSMTERFNKYSHKYITEEIVRKNQELIFNNDFTKGVKTYNNTNPVNTFPDHWEISSNILNDNAASIIQIHVNNILTPVIYHYNPQSGFMAGYNAMQAETGNSDFNFFILANINKYFLNPVGVMQDAVAKSVQLTTVDNLKISIQGFIIKEINYWAMAGDNIPAVNASMPFHLAMHIKIIYASGSVLYLSGMASNPVWSFSNGNTKVVIPSPSYNNNSVLSNEHHTDDFNIEFDTPVFPYDGIADFEFRFYPPRTIQARKTAGGIVWSKIHSAVIKNISVRYITDGKFSDEIITNFSTFTIANSKDNIYEDAVYLGDGPVNFVANSFRIHSMSVNPYVPFWKSNTVTVNWRKLNDATLKSAADIFSITAFNKFFTNYQRIIRGDYFGDFGMLHCLVMTDPFATKRYILLSDNYNVKTSVHSIEMQEITSSTKSVTSSYIGGPSLINAPAPNPLPPSPVSPNLIFSNFKNVSTSPTTSTMINTNTNYPG